MGKTMLPPYVYSVALECIQDQINLLADLHPGSEEHRLVAEELLLMQDGLAVLHEIAPRIASQGAEADKHSPLI